MKKRSVSFAYWCALLLSPMAMSTHAASSDLDELRGDVTSGWQLVKNDARHQIVTYAKREDEKQIRSFKVRAEMTGTVDDMLKVFLDFDNWKRWSWKVRISKLVKKISATEYYAYITHDAPFGVPDRDVVLHMQFEPYSANHPYVGIKLNAVPDFVPLEPSFVRVQAETMSMKIYNVGNGRLIFENEGYVDPASGMPTWAINFIQRSAPYSIVLGMQRRLESKQFNEDFVVPFATR